MIVKKRVLGPPKILILNKQRCLRADIISKQFELFDTSHKPGGVIIASAHTSLPVVPELSYLDRFLNIIFGQNLACSI